ncbi:MAG: hypothetical protein IPP38_04175 [Bacteroidetes bacterium]|nr:hypothetical protein [Bacteroidota bacterium]
MIAASIKGLLRERKCSYGHQYPSTGYKKWESLKSVEVTIKPEHFCWGWGTCDQMDRWRKKHHQITKHEQAIKLRKFDSLEVCYPSLMAALPQSDEGAETRGRNAEVVGT